VPNANVGVDFDVTQLRADSDAIVVCTGATWPRDLKIPNREVDGVHFAMEFLQVNYLHQLSDPQLTVISQIQLNTQSLLDSELQNGNYITAKDKDVIVIGGGDTGNDCIGTSIRHRAKSVTNFELLPSPPPARGRDNPWPQWPRQALFIHPYLIQSLIFLAYRIFRTDYGHTEVAAHFGNGGLPFYYYCRPWCSIHSIPDPREYCISTKEFVVDSEGKLKGLDTGKLTFRYRVPMFTVLAIILVRVEWTKDSGGRWKMEEVPGSEKFFPAQLVLLALGFLGPQAEVIKALGVKQDVRSNIQTPPKVSLSVNIFEFDVFNTVQKFCTNIEGVFAAGDCRRGQSLIVWGIK